MTRATSTSSPASPFGDSSTSPTTSASSATIDRLRRLYLVRFVFAAAWAGAFAAVGSSLDAASVTLLLLYPAVDVAAAVVDFRSSRGRALYVNMALSTAAVIGLALASAGDMSAVLRVWGAWAILAGLVQLFLALKRRALGGQWAMILSGGISVIAGGGFLGMAASATSLKVCAGYASLGGVFFLISGVRLLRKGRRIS